MTPKVLVLDVDGVLTDGGIYYTAEGKVMKRFGPDDNDAISLLLPYMDVQVISGDVRGFPITRRRVEVDMKLPLACVSTLHRIDWIESRWPLNEVIYMGDGIFDAAVMAAVGYSVAPADADPLALATASHVCARGGGQRAVAEACMHILTKFFEPFDLTTHRQKDKTRLCQQQDQG